MFSKEFLENWELEMGAQGWMIYAADAHTGRLFHIVRGKHLDYWALSGHITAAGAKQKPGGLWYSPHPLEVSTSSEPSAEEIKCKQEEAVWVMSVNSGEEKDGS